MSSIQTYEDLIAWQKAHKLVLGVYKATQNSPKEELFGLTSQLRRATLSGPSNIVEGFNRRGQKDKIRFYNMAEASLEEAHYQLRVAHDLGYADTSQLSSQARETKRILAGLIASVETAR